MSPARRVWAPVVHRIVAEPATASALEAVGLLTLADHADRIRSGRDIVAIDLPIGPRALRRRRVKLLRRGGADQATRAMQEGGWLGYEPPLPDVLLRSVRAFDGEVFDVGANTGLYSLIAAAARRGVAVHAFEAFPPVADMLVENLALNLEGRRVRVNRVAVAERSGRLTLHVPPPSGDTVETSASLDQDFKGGGGEAIDVEAVSLDEYWKAAGAPPLSVVKIDTEGTEHRVLDGARAVLSGPRPVVFFEFLPRGAGALLDDLAAALDLVDVRMSPEEGVIGDRVTYHERAWNHAFVPVEKVGPFAAVLADAGLVVTRLDLRR